MTISRCAFSPTRPPPSYQRSPVVPVASTLSVPDGTLVTARSGWAMPWSTGGGNNRSAHGPSGGVESTRPNSTAPDYPGKPPQGAQSFGGTGHRRRQSCPRGGATLRGLHGNSAGFGDRPREVGPHGRSLGNGH